MAGVSKFCLKIIGNFAFSIIENLIQCAQLWPKYYFSHFHPKKIIMDNLDKIWKDQPLCNFHVTYPWRKLLLDCNNNFLLGFDVLMLILSELYPPTPITPWVFWVPPFPHIILNVIYGKKPGRKLLMVPLVYQDFANVVNMTRFVPY